MDSLAEVVGRGGPGPGHAEPAESPEDAVLRDEERSLEEKRRGELRRCIAELPPRMRQCLLLQLQGLKYTQIANAMGISVDTVRANLHQARVRLRDRLGGRPESPEDDDPEGR
jgi:RNA polymerase sigma factor (sigma-70 family)